MQLATAEAFSQAVATHFPPRFVRARLQQAPRSAALSSRRRPRSIRPYRKYSRTPEIEVTSQIADTLPTFGGSTVGAAMRAAGAQFPLRARMHIYQSAPGTTLPRMVRIDRPAAGAGRGYVNAANVHPLTPAAAGVLLREPQLGVPVPAAYLRSRQRIAVGPALLSARAAGRRRAGGSARSAAARRPRQRLRRAGPGPSVNLRQVADHRRDSTCRRRRRSGSSRRSGKAGAACAAAGARPLPTGRSDRLAAGGQVRADPARGR